MQSYSFETCKCWQGIWDLGRTRIAVEREHKEWRDHRTNLMWHPRASLTYPRFRTGALRTHTWHNLTLGVAGVGRTAPPTQIPNKV